MRKPEIDHLIFRKRTPDYTLRQRIIALANDGERVGDLIPRCIEAGLGTEKQIRAALYSGRYALGAPYTLEKPE
jgi:hypothetical protein